jgi:hypothetical protein
MLVIPGSASRPRNDDNLWCRRVRAVYSDNSMSVIMFWSPTLS